MSRRITRAVRPCLRQLNCCSKSLVQSPHPPIFQHFSTTKIENAATSNSSRTAAAGLPVDFASTTKPTSARPIDTRKSQMIRTYTSMLRTSPLILFFQHSNLTADEWAAIRRELKKSLNAVPDSPLGPEVSSFAPDIKLQVLRTHMLDIALQIVEFHDPSIAAALPSTERSTRGPLVHDLSKAAYDAIKKTKVAPDSAYAQLQPLMVGPIAGLVMPAVSPAHVAAALKVLSPIPGKYPAPTRKKSPGWHDTICQNGLAKLTLVGGRVEGKIFDQAGVSWVGGIQGGLSGLRAQLVGILQGAGLGVTSTLEGGSKALWLTLESHRTQLGSEAGEQQKDNKPDQ